MTIHLLLLTTIFCRKSVRPLHSPYPQMCVKTPLNQSSYCDQGLDQWLDLSLGFTVVTLPS